MRHILIRPLVTEKMTAITEKENKFGFIVEVNANKIEIAKAIKQKFNVDVVSIKTIKYKGKQKTQFTKRGRFTGRTSQFKKAIVSLKEGQTIDILGEV